MTVQGGTEGHFVRGTGTTEIIGPPPSAISKRQFWIQGNPRGRRSRTQQLRGPHPDARRWHNLSSGSMQEPRGLRKPRAADRGRLQLSAVPAPRPAPPWHGRQLCTDPQGSVL